MSVRAARAARPNRAVFIGLALALGVSGGMRVGAVVHAAPAPQTAGPGVAVSPAQAEPGGSVRVVVSGVAGLPAAGTTLCIGFLGPGNNLELGLSPSFRSRLGTVGVNSAGAGTADVRVPLQAAAGVYRIRVGGCPPQPDLAPLAAIAETQLTVTRSGVTGLPATGDGRLLVPPAGAALAVLGGLALARRTVRRS